jgi:hypothetical protein
MFVASGYAEGADTLKDLHRPVKSAKVNCFNSYFEFINTISSHSFFLRLIGKAL